MPRILPPAIPPGEYVFTDQTRREKEIVEGKLEAYRGTIASAGGVGVSILGTPLAILAGGPVGVAGLVFLGGLVASVVGAAGVVRGAMRVRSAGERLDGPVGRVVNSVLDLVG